jgi:hypothetical protein
MNSESPQKEGLKQKASHELVQFGGIFLYLAFFFCSVATYRMLLLNEFHVWYFTYGFALINAFVIAKIILIGEYAHLGEMTKSRPLLHSAVYKAFLFGLLVFGFHIVEEVIKKLLHGGNIAAALHNIRINDLLGRSVVIFCTFICFFAFRELRRVLGEEKFRDLFFKTRPEADTRIVPVYRPLGKE